ncbi:MAG: hypothetical protein SAL70_19700 [Scytonema sp. PMC 1070.18]|nr:hypothetical protein [Scytonema sp. PMC 1070.18]
MNETSIYPTPHVVRANNRLLLHPTPFEVMAAKISLWLVSWRNRISDSSVIVNRQVLGPL